VTNYILGPVGRMILRAALQGTIRNVKSQGAHDSSPAKSELTRTVIASAEVATGAAPKPNPLRLSVHKEAASPHEGHRAGGSASTLGEASRRSGMGNG
jgi:hypothetical protein